MFFIIILLYSINNNNFYHLITKLVHFFFIIIIIIIYFKLKSKLNKNADLLCFFIPLLRATMTIHLSIIFCIFIIIIIYV